MDQHEKRRQEAKAIVRESLQNAARAAVREYVAIVNPSNEPGFDGLLASAMLSGMSHMAAYQNSVLPRVLTPAEMEQAVLDVGAEYGYCEFDSELGKD